MSRAAQLGVAVALAGWALIGILLWQAWPAIRQLVDPNRPRTFYIPAENMLPTLRVNDRIRPRQSSPEQLRRGMVIVFEGPADTRVGRIVAVAGDVVQMRGGSLLLNGRPVSQRRIGVGPSIDGEATVMLAERLPGEGSDHRILDCGASQGDEYGPVRVPADMLFVLGDNRDRSADSRYPPEVLGVGLVRAAGVVGTTDRLLRSAGFHDFGRPLDGKGSR